jgi:hypothetical protein
MAKKTAKHRVKMVVEFEFGYYDEIGFTDKNRLATKTELINELKRELKMDGLAQFVQSACHNPKTKLKSLAFVKFDK